MASAEYMRQWRKANPGRHAEIMRAYRKRNPKRAEEVQTKFKAKHPGYSKKWAENQKRTNPERFARWKRENQIRRFGISLETHQQMLLKQDSKCAICDLKELKRELSIDHCHKTGKIRGLLCNRCNRALGGFKDNPALICRALEYLLR